jgi:holo-[acyl-carrier protein] synthase
MIAGIGIDIVSVSRIAEKIQHNGFKEKIFSLSEREYCERNNNNAQHYAVRFAAKEAFLKATGRGLMAGYNLKDIAIAIDELGKPSIMLANSFQELENLNSWSAIHLSLSHEGDSAIAMVIIEK